MWVFSCSSRPSNQKERMLCINWIWGWVCYTTSVSPLDYKKCYPFWESNHGPSFNVCHPEVFNTYINIQWCVSHHKKNFTMFIIVLGQHVSILIESTSGPSKKINRYLESFKMCCLGSHSAFYTFLSKDLFS